MQFIGYFSKVCAAPTFLKYGAAPRSTLKPLQCIFFTPFQVRCALRHSRIRIRYENNVFFSVKANEAVPARTADKLISLNSFESTLRTSIHDLFMQCIETAPACASISSEQIEAKVQHTLDLLWRSHLTEAISEPHADNTNTCSTSSNLPNGLSCSVPNVIPHKTLYGIVLPLWRTCVLAKVTNGKLLSSIALELFKTPLQDHVLREYASSSVSASTATSTFGQTLHAIRIAALHYLASCEVYDAIFERHVCDVLIGTIHGFKILVDAEALDSKRSSSAHVLNMSKRASEEMFILLHFAKKCSASIPMEVASDIRNFLAILIDKEIADAYTVGSFVALFDFFGIYSEELKLKICHFCDAHINSFSPVQILNIAYSLALQPKAIGQDYFKFFYKCLRVVDVGFHQLAYPDLFKFLVVSSKCHPMVLFNWIEKNKKSVEITREKEFYADRSIRIYSDQLIDRTICVCQALQNTSIQSVSLHILFAILKFLSRCAVINHSVLPDTNAFVKNIGACLLERLARYTSLREEFEESASHGISAEQFAETAEYLAFLGWPFGPVNSLHALEINDHICTHHPDGAQVFDLLFMCMLQSLQKRHWGASISTCEITQQEVSRLINAYLVTNENNLSDGINAELVTSAKSDAKRKKRIIENAFFGKLSSLFRCIWAVAFARKLDLPPLVSYTAEHLLEILSQVERPSCTFEVPHMHCKTTSSAQNEGNVQLHYENLARLKKWEHRRITSESPRYRRNSLKRTPWAADFLIAGGLLRPTEMIRQLSLILYLKKDFVVTTDLSYAWNFIPCQPITPRDLAKVKFLSFNVLALQDKSIGDEDSKNTSTFRNSYTMLPTTYQSVPSDVSKKTKQHLVKAHRYASNFPFPVNFVIFPSDAHNAEFDAASSYKLGFLGTKFVLALFRNNTECEKILNGNEIMLAMMANAWNQHAHLKRQTQNVFARKKNVFDFSLLPIIVAEVVANENMEDAANFFDEIMKQ